MIVYVTKSGKRISISADQISLYQSSGPELCVGSSEYCEAVADIVFESASEEDCVDLEENGNDLYIMQNIIQDQYKENLNVSVPR